jgi:dihydroorotase
MVRGLAAGEIDVIVSSHDPQDVDVKRHPFAEAADGAIGLETLLAAGLRLYHNGEVGLVPLLRAMTINPAKLLGLPSGRLEKGAPADLILVDLGQPSPGLMSNFGSLSARCLSGSKPPPGGVVDSR